MSKLLINEEPLQVLPSLAKAIGLNEAIFLQQVHYWLAKSKHRHDGRVWIYNTVEDWVKQFPFWSDKTIRRIIANLRKSGLLITTDEYNKRSFDNTLWYTIDHDKLKELEIASGQVDQTMWSDCPDDVVNLTRPIPENTTENTTEREKKAAAPAADPTPFERVWIAWDKNMPGVKTPVIVDAVNGWIDIYSAAEIEEAIAIACKRNKRNFSYVNGILTRGAFAEKPKPSGGDYAPQHRTTNRGLKAVQDYMREKGMIPHE
jgi:DnaD/phage-associated family protein